ncbi:hypothetical protein AA23498_2662 [Acetobacter nitrogenifigens DSM 23921 = NBRC 105050]|nr:hypothetical protein [Acetobacter nitrogenifigens]GBQ96525.1 hypothetical protein AA23498_2662 [Acetobacter nitrogenifigens DSM 23921 = NBRC 105050]
MHAITIDTQADRLAEELARRGVPAQAQIHAVIHIHDDGPDMTSIAAAGGAFDWLKVEPDLYTDADIVNRPT